MNKIIQQLKSIDLKTANKRLSDGVVIGDVSLFVKSHLKAIESNCDMKDTCLNRLKLFVENNIK